MFKSPGEVAFSIFSVDIYFYGIIMAIAIFLGLLVIIQIAKKFFPEFSADKILDISFLLIFWGIIGARLYYVLLDYKYFIKYPLEILALRNGGISIQGAIIAGIIVGIYYIKKHNIILEHKIKNTCFCHPELAKLCTGEQSETRLARAEITTAQAVVMTGASENNFKTVSGSDQLKSEFETGKMLKQVQHDHLNGFTASYEIKPKKHNINFFRIADLFVFGLVTGQIIGRWGNFFNSEAFGTPTDLPWKLYIPYNNRPFEYKNYEFFHPAFLYESLLNLCIFFILYFILTKCKKRKDGLIFYLYIILYSIVRIFVEFLRTDSVMNIYGIHIAHITSFIFILAAVIGLYILYSKKIKV